MNHHLGWGIDVGIKERFARIAIRCSAKGNSDIGDIRVQF
jgi:hypothetical protein